MCSPLLVDIRDHGSVVRGHHYLETLDMSDPSFESIDNCLEFEAIDMQGCLLLGPCARDLHIVHKGSPAMG
jgi:hypothetical protein